MGSLIALIFGNLLQPIVYRVLALLGIGLFTYVGLDQVKTLVLSNITSTLSGITGSIVGMLGLVGVDHYITLIISAYFSVFAVNQGSRVLGFK